MKRFIIFLNCVALVMFLFAGTVAEAQTSNYAVVKAGVYSPNSSDLGGFNTGFNGEVAFGHYFNKNFAMELGLGYFESSGSGSSIFNAMSGSGTGDIYAVPLTLAVKAIYPMDRWEIYAIGGMGAYFCNGKFSISTGSFNSDQSATAFGGFLGGGADYTLYDNWFFGIEGKYLWATPEFNFFGQKVDVKFDGWTVTGNIGFRF
jgi:outer membrane protein W